MPYLGKVVGTVAGLVTGQPWLAALGLVLGHQFDRGFAARFSGLGSDGSSAYVERLPEGFVRCLFQVMGHLAKADGRVSEDEIRAARSLMHRLGLGPAQMREAIRWFDSGKPSGFPLSDSIDQLRSRYAQKPEQQALFLRLLMEVSLSKGVLHQRERAIIWTICTQLGVGRVELAQLEAMLRAQRGFRRSPEGSADTNRVEHAYKVLGVSKTNTNAEIKTAYRRLMNKNHPDKLASDNPGAEQLAEAQKKTREVRGAYEMLKARRSIR